jgi:hypothetical protein
MAEDEIIKHVKSAYETFTDKGKNWKHKLKEILLEILIIVFAVSISIWFHNWSESLKDGKAEKTFLRGLKTDLQTDLTELKSDRDALQNILNGGLYFSQVGAGLPLNKDSLAKYYWIFFASVHKQSRTSRFEALKGSGKLDIIENKELLGNIISFYQEIYPTIALGDERFTDYTENKIGNFFDAHIKLDTANNITNWVEVLRLPELRMNLFRSNSVRIIINAYDEGIRKCNEIIKQIDEELK